MPLKSQHVVVTMTGAAQQLPALLAGNGVRSVSFQPGGSNSAPVFIGGSDVSSSSWGVRLPAATAGEPPAPYIPGEFEDGSLSLDDFWVFGTANDVLHIHVLAYI